MKLASNNQKTKLDILSNHLIYNQTDRVLVSYEDQEF